ncbi:hypothetical protein [Lacrimispora indolis]|uniref:hypothetical protein n=1 Tax=Lacrimispora indolis TaxID=69825 RepID=UPI0003F87709|nr:hypothetical protein [[Clostridium] methoxybenzovorans]
MSELGTLALTTTPVTVPMTIQTTASDNVDYTTANTITIVESGVYRIDVLIAGASSSDEDVLASFVINGTPQTTMQQSLQATSDTTTTFAMADYYTLTAGDLLTLQMQSLVAPITFFFPATGLGARILVERIA